jgi:hypothetical protein
MRLALALALFLLPGIAGAQPTEWRCDRQWSVTHCYAPDAGGRGSWQMHIDHSNGTTNVVPPMQPFQKNRPWKFE